MTIMICSTKYNGCGHVDNAIEWDNAFRDGDWLMCPMCREDHTFGLNNENINRLTDEDNYTTARELLDKEIDDENKRKLFILS